MKKEGIKFVLIANILSILLISFMDRTTVSHVLALRNVKVGDVAPVFSLKTVEGRRVSLEEELRQKVVLLIFWKAGHPNSQKGLKGLERLWKEFKDKGVIFLAIESHNSVRKIKEEVDGLGISFPILIDDDKTVYGEYGVVALPTVAIIGKDGILKYTYPSYNYAFLREVKYNLKYHLGLISQKELKHILYPKTHKVERSLRRAKLQIRMAERLLQKKREKNALKALQKAEALNPKDANLWIKMGELYYRLGEKQKALDAFRRAQQISPDSLEAKAGLARIEKEQ